MALLTDFFDRGDFLAWDLSVDHAVTANQAYRWYGLRQYELELCGLYLEPRFLKATTGTRNFRRITFVLAEREKRSLSTSALYHLAGTAEMRFALGAPASSWASTAYRQGATMVPDAIWNSPQGEVAIEFDTGSYSRERILDKAGAFALYKGQVWGSPTKTRAENVEGLVLPVDSRARVVVAAAF